MTSAFFKEARWVISAATGNNDTWVAACPPTGVAARHVGSVNVIQQVQLQGLVDGEVANLVVRNSAHDVGDFRVHIHFGQVLDHLSLDDMLKSVFVSDRHAILGTVQPDRGSRRERALDPASAVLTSRHAQ